MLREGIAADSRDRLQREVRAASALTHPNIRAVYDLSEASGRLFLVLELAEGQTLRDYAGKKPMDPAEVISIGIQIADALEAAHAKGVIHRDIKSGNIMVTARRHVKVLDFGPADRAGRRGPDPDCSVVHSGRNNNGNASLHCA